MEFFKIRAVASIFIVLLLCSPQILAYDSVDSFFQNDAKFKVLVFLSRSCPCSRSHVDHLNGLDKKYKEVAFFGVITDIFNEASKDDIQKYYAGRNFQFPLVKDESQTLIKEYKALKTPHSVLLQRTAQGTYNVVYEGGVTNRRDFSTSTQKFLGENLEAITQNKPIVYRAGKSLGCYIRRI
ncbi:MAG: redoxin domain-containing protein [Bdellovibrionales bacterium]|nr:redoxin domain-containing protein [Bdellovibrionales bacterium]